MGNYTRMNAITADINGIIRELSLSEADLLVSLYESVVNSIQSIEELHSKEACTIRVVIERDKSQQ